ncbi:MAG: Prolipoprotein diacylglyceryl transferase, partial [Candidatus Berkelbacteria bacterium]|nr:Prolipoprotein diacylglyceryl transferase [Candidatus Berkelbacteria bacterium]
LNILPHGFIFWTGLDLYFLGRFIIDFWRADTIMFFNLSSGQITSLLLFLGIFVYLVLSISKLRRAYKGDSNA